MIFRLDVIGRFHTVNHMYTATVLVTNSYHSVMEYPTDERITGHGVHLIGERTCWAVHELFDKNATLAAAVYATRHL